MWFRWTCLSLFVVYSKAQNGLTAQLFQLGSSSNPVNNAKLQWNIINSNASSFQVQRASGNGAYQTIATVAGNSYDDYDLTVGSSYKYQIESSAGTSDSSPSLVPFNKDGTWQSFDNTATNSGAHFQGDIKLDGVYYSYSYISTGAGTFYIQEQTSNDGYNFSGDTNVLNSSVICSSVSDGLCKLEGVSFNQHPTTNQVVMWAHFENSVDYDLAEVACAFGTPGEQLTFAGTYRPLGYDSRDLSFWVDDEASGYAGYLISATDTNSNVNIYSLSSNWTVVNSLAAEVLINQYREAPAMAKVDGMYYLFTSRASGWYPSQPFVISAPAITGPWTDPTVPGQDSTYASQSGWLASSNRVNAMFSTRWAAEWVPQDGGNNYGLMLPISYSQDGSANYFYYPTVTFTNSQSASSVEGAIGVQSGKILSRYQPITAAPSGGVNLTAAADGVDNNNNVFYQPPSVPFSLQIDLSQAYTLTQLDMSFTMVQGSECYYQYIVSGSSDGSSYTTIADNSNNTQVGFLSNLFSDNDKYRYVNVSVSSVTNTHNQNAAPYFAGITEMTVYGS